MRSRSNQIGTTPTRSERTSAVALALSVLAVLAVCALASRGISAATRPLCSDTPTRRLEASVAVARTDVVAFMGSTQRAAENGRIVPITQQLWLPKGYCLHDAWFGYRDRHLSPR